MTIADRATASAAARLERFGRAPSSTTRAGEGWVAVATGVWSNDMNGVVSRPGAVVDDATVAGLLAWFADDGLPASWILTGADPALDERLVAHGARSDDDGRWAGGPLTPVEPEPVDGVDVRPVVDGDGLDAWLTVAAACEWLDGDGPRRRALYVGLGLDGPLRHWVAWAGDRPVGMASSFVDGDVLDLCNLAVLPDWRRRGIGRALTRHRGVDAAGRGATTVVAALSPEGWALHETLGLRTVPVVPGRWFHLPRP